MSDFGELLKRLRKKAKLTQKQLGDKLHLSKTMVSYYEHSRRYPPADVLVQMADLFHVSVDYILGREKSEQTLNLNGLSDKDIEFVQGVVTFLQEKNEKQREEEKNKKRDKDTTANV